MPPIRNRYYDPTLTTFTSVDPLVAATGTPYLYANANPTTYTDPTGLATGAACSWVVGADAGCTDVETQGDGSGSMFDPRVSVGAGLVDAAYSIETGSAAGDESYWDAARAVGDVQSASLWGDLIGVGYRYYQALQFHYWMHRLVQTHMLRTHLVGGSRMELPAGGGRVDLAAPMFGAGWWIAELKPSGRGSDPETGRQLRGYLASLPGSSAAVVGAGGFPASDSVSVFATPVSVRYYFLQAGVYEYSYTGGMPTPVAFRQTVKDDVKQYVAWTVPSDAQSFIWPGAPVDVDLLPTLATAGVIVACVLLCVFDWAGAT
jgi:hypothetical protein